MGAMPLLKNDGFQHDNRPNPCAPHTARTALTSLIDWRVRYLVVLTIIPNTVLFLIFQPKSPPSTPLLSLARQPQQVPAFHRLVSLRRTGRDSLDLNQDDQELLLPTQNLRFWLHQFPANFSPRFPLRCRIIGDMSNTERVLVGLDIQKKA